MESIGRPAGQAKNESMCSGASVSRSRRCWAIQSCSRLARRRACCPGRWPLDLPRERSSHGGGQGGGRTADEMAEVARRGVELAVAGRLHVGVSEEVGEFGWETNALEHGLVGLLGQVLVDDLLARLVAHFRRELRHGE